MREILPLNLRQCWRMVGRCDTLEKVAIAERWLLSADITNAEYDALMNVLALLARDLHNTTDDTQEV